MLRAIDEMERLMIFFFFRTQTISMNIWMRFDFKTTHDQIHAIQISFCYTIYLHYTHTIPTNV